MQRASQRAMCEHHAWLQKLKSAISKSATTLPQAGQQKGSGMLCNCASTAHTAGLPHIASPRKPMGRCVLRACWVLLVSLSMH